MQRQINSNDKENETTYQLGKGDVKQYDERNQPKIWNELGEDFKFSFSDMNSSQFYVIVLSKWNTDMQKAVFYTWKQPDPVKLWGSEQ